MILSLSYTTETVKHGCARAMAWARVAANWKLIPLYDVTSDKSSKMNSELFR